MKEISEEESQLIAEVNEIKSEVIQSLLPALAQNKADQRIIDRLAECGLRLEWINQRQPVAQLERKQKAAHDQRMREQEAQARKADKGSLASQQKFAVKSSPSDATRSKQEQSRADYFLGHALQKVVETSVQKEVNRQMRSNGGVIRIESGSGK